LHHLLFFAHFVTVLPATWPHHSTPMTLKMGAMKAKIDDKQEKIEHLK